MPEAGTPLAELPYTDEELGAAYRQMMANCFQQYQKIVDGYVKWQQKAREHDAFEHQEGLRQLREGLSAYQGMWNRDSHVLRIAKQNRQRLTKV